MSCNIVDDIEDILKQEPNESQDIGIDEFNRASNKSFVIPKIRKKAKLPTKIPEDEVVEMNGHGDGSVDAADDDQVELNGSSNAPGVASIFVRTWGCTHNSSDSEYMAGQLAAYGYKIVGKLWLVWLLYDFF